MKFKIIIASILAFLLASSIYLGWQNSKLVSERENLRQNLSTANLSIGEGNTRIEDANKKVSSLDQELQKEIKELKASIIRYSELQTKYSVLQRKLTDMEVSYLSNGNAILTCESLALMPGMLYQASSTTELKAIKELTGSLSDNRLSINCMAQPKASENFNIPMLITYDLNMKIRGQIIEVKDPEGIRHNYLKLYEIDSNGKDIGELKLLKYDTIVDDKTAAHFQWKALHIDLGVFGGVSNTRLLSTGGSFGFSSFAYGRTDLDVTWRFPRLSIDMLASDIGLGVSPLLYNLGDKLPLFTNLWIGPHLVWGIKESSFGFFLGTML